MSAIMFVCGHLTRLSQIYKCYNSECDCVCWTRRSEALTLPLLSHIFQPPVWLAVSRLLHLPPRLSFLLHLPHLYSSAFSLWCLIMARFTSFCHLSLSPPSYMLSKHAIAWTASAAGKLSSCCVTERGESAVCDRSRREEDCWPQMGNFSFEAAVADWSMCYSWQIYKFTLALFKRYCQKLEVYYSCGDQNPALHKFEDNFETPKVVLVTESHVRF